MALFRTLEFSIDEASEHPDLLWAIHKGEVDLAIVRGVLPPSACARVVSELETRADSWPWTPQETHNAKQVQFRLIGESLAPYAGHPDGPELAHYFAEAARFRALCRDLFRRDPDFEEVIEGAMHELGGGRGVALPAGVDPGSTYTPATLRHLPPGCEIPVHVGNYFLTTPACRHLSRLVDLEDQLSFFLPLQTPESGGELVVYRVEWGDDRVPEMTRDKRANWDDGPEPWECQAFAPGTGDLLVFNGGRFYHRVSRVRGPLARWTIGGFMGFSPDAGTVYYWS